MHSVCTHLLELIAFTGLGAMTVASLHPHSTQTRFIHALFWPSVKPKDRLVMPPGGMLFCIGATLAHLNACPSHHAPL